ncbi:MAG: FkbM family methyltransferase [Rhodospirillaceae bacterium]|nr:FkbM family methyltransferase [Rhodospirillaceae bacterium]
MTKTLARLLNGLIRLITAFLPRWKRLTVRARLYDKLLPFEMVKVGEKSLKLFIPDRTCIYWAKEGPDSEPVTNAWIKSFSPDDTFVDIGANIGLYSLMAAAHGVSKVYAVEPNPFSFAVLARNIYCNGFDSIITPLCLAMNENSSMVTFKLGGMQAGTIGNEIASEDLHPDSISLTAASFSVDELFRIQKISGVNHLKIDIDGLELEILRGSAGLLSDPALKTILVEDNSENDRDGMALSSFIEQFGFRQTDAWGHDTSNNKIFSRRSS